MIQKTRWGRALLSGLGVAMGVTVAMGQTVVQPVLSPRGDVRIVVLSDFNSAYGSTDYDREVDSTVARVPRLWQPDLVLSGGDMVAGQRPTPRIDSLGIVAMWGAFDARVAGPLRRANLPFAFTLGNHDGSGARLSDGTESWARDRRIAARHWLAPERKPRLAFVDSTRFPFAYTFRVKDVFVMVWDASTATMTAEQKAWAAQALASPAARSASMRIAVGHLPIYSVAVGRDRVGEVLTDPEGMRALLEAGGVHTYVSGHHHAFYPAHRGRLEMLHSGAVGQGPRQWVGSSLAPRKSITVVDVHLAEGRTTHTTYDATTLELIDPKVLPEVIVGVNGTTYRRDVGEEPVTSTGTARVQVIHNTPDPALRTVDVYLNGAKWLDNLAYRTASPLLTVPAGRAEIALTAADAAGPASPLYSTTVLLGGGTTARLVATGLLAPTVGLNPDARLPLVRLLQTRESRDGLTGNLAGLRLVHGSPDLPGVTVRLVGGAVLADGLRHGEVGAQVLLPEGRHQVEVVRALDGARLASGWVTLRAGDVSTVLLSGQESSGGVGLLGVAADGTSALLSAAPSPVEQGSVGPMDYKLFPAQPNPFNPTTLLSYRLARSSRVTFGVFDVLGREVRRLFASEQQSAGEHRVAFDADDLPGGVYLCRFVARPDGGEPYTATNRIALVK